MRASIAGLTLAMGLAACGGTPGDPRAAGLPTAPPAPVPTGPLAPDTRAALGAVWADVGFPTNEDIEAIGATGDARVAWLLVDLLRFVQGSSIDAPVLEALADLTAVRPGPEDTPWVYSDLLLRWDVAAPPKYLARKRIPFERFGDPRWEPFFDERATLDWREVSWGGVFLDGIAPLNDPPMVRAENANWLPDDDIVFGITVGERSAAYPRRILEVHELVNASLGGRRFALPYCTLCGTANAWFTDDRTDGEPWAFGTSGLLRRSNKLMYETSTMSLFDQFDGVAQTGPLLRRAKFNPDTLLWPDDL